MSQSTESRIEQPSPFQHQKIQNISIGGGLKKNVPIPCVTGVCELGMRHSHSQMTYPHWLFDPRGSESGNSLS